MYADYNDQTNQNLGNILGSILHQFLTNTQQPIPGEIFERLHNIRHQCRNVETDDILAMLKLRLRQFERVFICIDAVDELEPRVRQQLLISLKDFFIVTSDTRIFLTGRGHVESDVQESLEVVPRYKVFICANQQDIQDFVEQQITDDLNWRAMDEALKIDIVNEIIQKSQGM